MKRVLTIEAEREQFLAMIATYEIVRNKLPQGVDLPPLADMTAEITDAIDNDCEELRTVMEQQQPYVVAGKIITTLTMAWKKRKHGL